MASSMKKSVYFWTILFLNLPLEAAQNRRLLHKIDELDISMRKENLRRREEISEVRRMVGRMEELLNSSLANIDRTTESVTHSTKPELEIAVKEILSERLKEVEESYVHLQNGFYNEKKVASRFRRQVTQLKTLIDQQADITEQVAQRIGSILDALVVGSDERKAILNAFDPLSATLENLQQTNIDAIESRRFITSTLNKTSEETKNIMEKISYLGDVKTYLHNITEAEEDKKCAPSSSPVSTAPEIPCERCQLKSCLEYLEAGCKKSDVYSLFLDTGAIQVYCDQETDSGGWIVFQRRRDGSVDFYRTWQEYKDGFGSLSGEFWLGNDKIRRLLTGTTTYMYDLRIDLGDAENNRRYAKYSNFMIGPENENYILSVHRYTGNAGDALNKRHNGQQFSTKDRDNDGRRWGSCSQAFKGGWWYGDCYHANLNGDYNPEYSNKGLIWYHWKGWADPLKFTEMKYREYPAR